MAINLEHMKISSHGKRADENLKRTIKISLYSVFVGIIAGFGAVAFRYMIAFFHNLFFCGKTFFYLPF